MPVYRDTQQSACLHQSKTVKLVDCIEKLFIITFSSSVCLAGVKSGVFTCVGWNVTLCDLTIQYNTIM